jgi:MinD-like ATPase involved in chromosome partitioning or flagellar assembly
VRTFALHSYKGGTGKTTLGANLAAILAKQGRDVAILDMDFQAPSLNTLFGITPTTEYINNFLAEKAVYSEVLTDLSNNLGLLGRLSIGFSNPDVEVIREQLAKDRKWHMQAISRLLVLKQKLENDGFQYLFLDSAPGVHYSSVNTIVASDVTIIISKIDNFDFEGVDALLSGLYTPLDKETLLLFNKVVPPLLKEPHHSNVTKTIEDLFSEKTKILGYLPCFCEVPLGMGSEIHTLTQPNTPFVQHLTKIAKKIETLFPSTESGG